MNDFERFSDYWEQAVNGLVYRLGSENTAILTKAQVQRLWKEELLEKRFQSKGVKHGARLFLEELEQYNPEIAQQIAAQLNSSVMPFGMGAASIAGQAGLAAAGMALAGMKNQRGEVRAASVLVGGFFAARAAREVIASRKDALKEAVEQEAARQLLTYEELFNKGA